MTETANLIIHDKNEPAQALELIKTALRPNKMRAKLGTMEQYERNH